MADEPMKNPYKEYISVYDMHTVLHSQRLLQGMIQQQVADKACISLRQYQKFESGERSIMTCSFVIACRVIEALGMDISDFYHGGYSINPSDE